MNLFARLDEINKIEIGTNLYIEVEDLDHSLHSSFVGLVQKEKIVITPPGNFDKYKEIISDAEITVKYIYEKSVFVFKTKLVDAVQHPVPLLMLAYPEEISREERRSIKRGMCFIPAKGQIMDHLVEGVIRDITPKGCRCNLFISEEDGITFKDVDMVTLYCKFPSSGEDIVLAGGVKNFHFIGKIVSVGLEFDNITEAGKKVINDYLYSIENFS